MSCDSCVVSTEEGWQIQEWRSLPLEKQKEWNIAMQERSVALQYPFWECLEKGQLNDFRYQYLCLEHPQRQIKILAVVYQITTDIAIFAPRRLHQVLLAVRRFWPGFLQWRMLECGTPITLTSPPWQLQPEDKGQEALPVLLRTIAQIARRDRHLLIILRDFEPNAISWRDTLQAQGYHWIPSLPNTWLTIRWNTPEEYLQSMRSYYRSKLQKYLKRNRVAGVQHRLERNFAGMAEDLCRQWMQVHENAKEYQREILTPDFYRALAEHPEVDAQVLLFYRQDRWVGHALLLRDGDDLRWLYMGREESVNDGLYLYIAYTVIKTAILQQAKRLEMGLTTYAIKQDLGAELVPVFMALRARWGWMNPFVGLGYRLLNDIPQLHQRKVFKQDGAE